jgi:hypothetical protein
MQDPGFSTVGVMAMTSPGGGSRSAMTGGFSAAVAANAPSSSSGGGAASRVAAGGGGGGGGAAERLSPSCSASFVAISGRKDVADTGHHHPAVRARV